uniref:Uncharacterized protein n=1 Tax=viral metagenome TaxID=1070528 RepID=A0A6C0ERI9_9ZZZZ
MQFENSFVDNYIYNENNETLVGGFPIQKLSPIQLDAKFDNMSIPVGLVFEKVIDTMKGGYVNHYKIAEQSISDLIDDNLFDNLINKISYREHKNTTKKRHNGGSHNKTKKSV